MKVDVIYTCKKCGFHQFVLVHEYIESRNYTETVPCGCEESETGIAMERLFETRTPCEATYELDADHRQGSLIDTEKVDSSEDEEIECETHCQECLETADQTDLHIEEDPEQYEELDSKFFVRCGKCNREIEFGWSHEDRGGRIWTCEDVDFNPWKSWVEPRYEEDWREKGWLRPRD